MTKPKGRSRESITEAREAQIIAIIDQWDPAEQRFSREALVRRIKSEMGLVLTRQGLMKRKEILHAFQRRQKELAGNATARVDKEPLSVVLERRVEELRAKVEQQAETIGRYKEMFLTYRYNARQHGITREQLEAPIPPRKRPEGSRG